MANTQGVGSGKGPDKLTGGLVGFTTCSDADETGKGAETEMSSWETQTVLTPDHETDYLHGQLDATTNRESTRNLDEASDGQYLLGNYCWYFRKNYRPMTVELMKNLLISRL